MRALVTGSCGFIGRYVLKVISDAIEYDVKNNPIDNITNSQRLASVMRSGKPDVVIHLAANPNPRLAWDEPLWDAETNILGTIKVLEASLNSGVKSFLYVSTGHVYDPDSTRLPISESHPCAPKTAYSVSKYCGELYCKYFAKRGLKVIILRLFNVFGPGQSEGYVVPDMINRITKAERGQVIEIKGTASDSRDFVFVGDVAQAIVKAAESGLYDEIINIGSGRETTIRQLCETIRALAGKEVSFSYVERTAGYVGGRMQADISKAKSLLGWTPSTSLEGGIRMILSSSQGTRGS